MEDPNLIAQLNGAVYNFTVWSGHGRRRFMIGNVWNAGHNKARKKMLNLDKSQPIATIALLIGNFIPARPVLTFALQDQQCLQAKPFASRQEEIL